MTPTQAQIEQARNLRKQERYWQREKARVYAEHLQKSPEDAELCAVLPERASEFDLNADALYRLMSDGLPDGIVEHDDWTQGAWK